MRRLWRVACSRPIVQNALRVSLVVGAVLNLVNQGDALLAGAGVSWIHLALYFAVPYCVASYSAAKNQLTQRGNQ